jgi:hypothetical protein
VKTTKSLLPAISWCLGGFLVVSVSHAADFKQSKFTQVVNEVRVISTVDDVEKPAVVNAIFTMPDLVRTGVSSRAELVAEDNTITRVGANTVFGFNSANRSIDLHQGSLLFHSPKGKGGGTIHTASATASVLGTTLIVTTTSNGGFKVIDLEGHVAITFSSGKRELLSPGQMTFILPGGSPSPVITIRLDDLTRTSLLVQGFDQPLPSWPLILEQIADQLKLINSGGAEDTGLLVGDEATFTTVQVVDANTIQGTERSPSTGGGITLPTTLTIDASNLSQYIQSGAFSAGSRTFAFGFLAPSSPPNVTIGASGLNLSSYGAAPVFDFVVPNGTLATTGSLLFTLNPSTTLLDLYAQTFSFAFGSTVQADVGTFELEPQTATTLSGVAIVDNAPASSAPGTISSLAVADPATTIPGGGIDFTSPSTIAFTNGSSINAPNLSVLLSGSTVTLNNATVQGAFVGLAGSTGVSIANGSLLQASTGNLLVLNHSSGNIAISGSTLKATSSGFPQYGSADTGQVFVTATGGAVTLDKSSVQGGYVTLDGDAGVSIANGSTVKATNWSLAISTAGGIDVSSSTISNTGSGGTVLASGTSGITVNGGTFNTTSGMGMIAGSGSVTVNNSSITTSNFAATAANTGGTITVQNTSISTYSLTLGAADHILLDESSLGSSAITGGSGTASFTATSPTSIVTVGNAAPGSGITDLSVFTTVNMTAHTINLANVNFGGSSMVNLKSNIAMLNVGSSVTGEVNFISNVTYGGPGHPAQNYVPIAQGGGYAPSTFPAPIQITGGAP